jgi:hypothetical protein
MTLQGKGFFISELAQCEGGSPEAILLAAQAAGLSHVLVKIGEGTQASSLDTDGNDLIKPLVQTLHTANITVWGWHVISGDHPEDEAAFAVQRLQELGLDGYVPCAGAEYETPGKEGAARAFMAAARSGLGNFPIALSAYRFPNFHPAFPWAAFLESCDASMPQIYWEAAHDAGVQLEESLRQYSALPHPCPCIPTGAAYTTPDGWAPTPEDIARFLASATRLGVSAVNFFSWEVCRSRLPDVWDAIAGFDWPVSEPTPQPGIAHAPQVGDYPPAGGGQPRTPDIQADAIKARLSSITAGPDAFVSAYLDALKSKQAGRLASLYAEEAIHVRGDKVLKGATVIRTGYSVFFFGLPAGATFELVGVDVRGDVSYLAWKAGTLTAYESITLRDGMIVLEYTYIE